MRYKSLIWWLSYPIRRLKPTKVVADVTYGGSGITATGKHAGTFVEIRQFCIDGKDVTSAFPKDKKVRLFGKYLPEEGKVVFFDKQSGWWYELDTPEKGLPVYEISRYEVLDE